MVILEERDGICIAGAFLGMDTWHMSKRVAWHWCFVSVEGTSGVNFFKSYHTLSIKNRVVCFDTINDYESYLCPFLREMSENLRLAMPYETLVSC